MGRAIIWMVVLVVLLGLICAAIATVIAVMSNARESGAQRKRQEQLEAARLEQQRIEFLRRNSGDY